MQTPLINTDAINSHTIFNDREHLLLQAAECLREDILDHAQSIPNLSWPPSIDDVSSDERKRPESLGSFLRQLLMNMPKRDTANRLIQSYSSDLIHGVTRGKTITAKRFFSWARTS